MMKSTGRRMVEQLLNDDAKETVFSALLHRYRRVHAISCLVRRVGVCVYHLPRETLDVFSQDYICALDSLPP